MSGPMKVEIGVGPVAGPSGSVIINGHDISNHVRSVRLSADVGDATVVDLRLTNVDVIADIQTEHIHLSDDCEEI